jgi:hypothetical protein
MSRGPVSEADTVLIRILRRSGVEVSPAQLERWRTAGVLPRNERRGLGRGAGSVSLVSADSVVIAEALGRAARRGRPLHQTVLQIFTFDPRFEVKSFLATPRLPLPEQAVRAALAWFVGYRENSLDRRIERAVASAPADEDHDDIALKLALRHYRSIYLSERYERNRDILTEGPRMTYQQAVGYAYLAVGEEMVGSDLYAKALLDSLGDTYEYQAKFEELIRFMMAENIRREFEGQPAHGSGLKRTRDMDIEAIRQTDFSTICNARDVLALLAEAAYIFKITRKTIPGDPMIRRLKDFLASSYMNHFWVRAAAPLAYTAPADSWKRMASAIVMICIEPIHLRTFQEMTEKIDFTLDDIESILSRASEKHERNDHK